MSFFTLEHRDKNSRARAGAIRTAHGAVLTPAFMPVGTRGAVKMLDQSDLDALGTSIVLANTYHLHLQPGADLIASQGGLHRFLGWNKPILTDSGGFQVFSLGRHKHRRPATPQHNNTKITLRLNNKTMKQFNNETAKQAANDRPTLSHGQLVKIGEDGVTFRSYRDGSVHRFTPESAIERQHQLGADIIMAFDECTPDTADHQYVRKAMERTHRWAGRSLAEHQRRQPRDPSPYPPLKRGGSKVSPPFKSLPRAGRGEGRGGEVSEHQRYLFGIIQGGLHRELREESARFISALDFDGIAVGGESIGYNMAATQQIMDWIYPLIPEDKPHYAMGVGLSPRDLLIAIDQGADMFDCVGPTRLGRHGSAYQLPNPAGEERLNLKNAGCAGDTRPIDEHCPCHVCARYSRSYLHHLFAAGEPTAARLTTIHNLHLALALMREAREAILNNRWKGLKQQWKIE
ncbi:MAG: tRNA-guanine transglycosylase [Candidatus Magasanikbacteria bacterium]|nr:tRNA-guanine transglycosylase [Candidatus Magasanikbacteria bacterium]